MLSQLMTLYRRRMRLLAGTPRELIVPLTTPLLFALVIAPALKRALGTFNPRVDYMTFVAVATVALLVPLNSMFAGISGQSQAINASSWASIRVGRPRGWRMRGRGPLSEVERARVKSLRAAGATLQQAAEAVGLSRDAL